MGDRSIFTLYLAGMATIFLIGFPILCIYGLTQILDFGTMTAWDWIVVVILLPLILSYTYMAYRLLKWLLYRQRGDGDKIVLMCLVCYLLLLIMAVMAMLNVSIWVLVIAIGLFVLFPIGYTLNSLRKWVKRRRNPYAYGGKKGRGRQETTDWEQEYYEQAWRRREEAHAQQQAYGQSNGQGQQGYENTNNSGTKYSNDDIVELFKILELKETATEAEAKAAYRELSKKWHPDTYPTDDPRVKELATEKFVKIQQAYEKIKERKGWK